MSTFNLVSNKVPSNDQENAISVLSENLKTNKFQVLLGATGTGKTFTIANVINKYNKPTIVLAHNKTLANQLYYEFKELFPNNRVEYFISYFDYYRPEAYLPGKDLYIEKQSVTNWNIELMRMSSLNALLHRNDTIIVASVAAIYGLREPKEYKKHYLEISNNQPWKRSDFLYKLVTMGYKRNFQTLEIGQFRVLGDSIEIKTPLHNTSHIRIEFFENSIDLISEIDTLNNNTLKKHQKMTLIPANMNVLSESKIKAGILTIESELEERLKFFENENLLLEKQRLEQRTNFDLEQLREFGMVSGIENYSSHFEDRKLGEPPYTLFDYLPKDSLIVIDESHITIPQINGMYKGDRSRKENLVNYGFRLPSALQNRPLKFEEFENKIKHAIFISATPANYELDLVDNKYVEQIIRPTGLLDPIIEIKSSLNQIDDIIEQIKERREVNERVFVTTITIKMSEEITSYLNGKGINAAYLHSELKTLERTELIRKLRLGIYDCIVGINLLREGLDVPEVSLVAILDADKDGFLRNGKSLIQIIGRAARNLNGKAIMYANRITDSMKFAVDETNRRRVIQEAYNIKNNITPTTIIKEIPSSLMSEEAMSYLSINKRKGKKFIEEQIKDFEKQMKDASKNFDFEKAILLRDLIIELKGEINVK